VVLRAAGGPAAAGEHPNCGFELVNSVPKNGWANFYPNLKLNLKKIYKNASNCKIFKRAKYLMLCITDTLNIDKISVYV
jgi:hypothetical protein